MANKTWNVASGADGAYSTAGNWTPSGVPEAGDDVHIPAGTGNITTGLDQSAVAIGDFVVEEGYTGTIGSAAGYLQIDPDLFTFRGIGQAYIDIGSAAISPQVFSSAQANIGLRGLYLKGSAIATLAVMGGSVGLAAIFGETSTATTVRVVGATASVWIGEGVTLTNFIQYAGDNQVHCAIGTLAEVFGGTLKTVGVGAVATFNVFAGDVLPESTGTITTMVLSGGTTSFLGHGSPRTVTNLKLNAGASLAYDSDVLTITNHTAPDMPRTLVAVGL